MPPALPLGELGIVHAAVEEHDESQAVRQAYALCDRLSYLDWGLCSKERYTLPSYKATSYLDWGLCSKERPKEASRNARRFSSYAESELESGPCSCASARARRCSSVCMAESRADILADRRADGVCPSIGPSNTEARAFS